MKVVIRILIGSFVLGVIAFTIGALSNNPTGYGNGEAGKPWIIIGLVLALVPVILGLAGLAIGLFRALVRNLIAYQAWKRTLSPQARYALRVAETAAILSGELVAQHKLREWGERVNAQVTQSQVNGFGG